MLAGAVSLALQACSYTYKDEAGATHVIGFQAVTLHAPDSRTVAGEVVDVQTLGVAAHHLADGRSFSIGYSRDVVGYLKNDVAVVGNPKLLTKRTGACAPGGDDGP